MSKMFESMCVVAVNSFNGSATHPATADKNGKNPIFLRVIAGNAPSTALVQSGTVAENQGFEIGKSYLAQCAERESNEYGRQFTWTKIKDLSLMEILDSRKVLGNALVFDPQTVEEVKKERVAANPDV